jgi:hypothetical protein
MHGETKSAVWSDKSLKDDVIAKKSFVGGSWWSDSFKQWFKWNLQGVSTTNKISVKWSGFATNVVFCLHPGMCDMKYHTLKQY